MTMPSPLTAPIFYNKHPGAARLDRADEFATFYVLELTDEDMVKVTASRQIRVGLQQLPNGKLVCGFEPV